MRSSALEGFQTSHWLSDCRRGAGGYQREGRGGKQRMANGGLIAVDWF